MMPKMKKPGVLGRGLPGWQQNGATKVAIGNHTKPNRAARLPTVADFYAAEIAQYKESRDDWAWGCCPFHSDRNPSFRMHLESGAFRCMSSNCGASGKSIVSFVCQRDGLTAADAIRHLENWS